MPSYDYKCSQCEEIFEEYTKFPRNYSKCPDCGGKARRVFSAPSIIFKGSGFYKTDYENKQRNNED